MPRWPEADLIRFADANGATDVRRSEQLQRCRMSFQRFNSRCAPISIAPPWWTRSVYGI